MYKIYVNQKVIILSSSPYITDARSKATVIRYGENPEIMKEWINWFVSRRAGRRLNFYHPDLDFLYKDFADIYTHIIAGGGIVKNSENKILAIYRKGFWDLPKGKPDHREKIEDTALREVKEETGVKKLILKKFLSKSHYFYKDKQDRILKIVYWYEMFSDDIDLVPQEKENISIVKWVKPEFFFKKGIRSFISIRYLLEEVFQIESKR